MVWPRRAPRAVLLGDGRVLALGDEGGKYEGPPGYSRIPELWDAATGTWRETDYLPTARGNFAVVTLLDGRAVVTGGINSEWKSYSSAYIYDPVAEHWTKTGLMGTARAAPAAVVLRDGRVLVIGGAYYTGVKESHLTGAAVLAAYRPASAGRGILPRPPLADTWPGPSGYALATAELFDPTTGTWSATGSMRYARIAPSAVRLADGRVLVTGSGWAERVDDRARSSAEIYDPATGRFTTVKTFPGVDTSVLEPMGAPSPGTAPADAVGETGMLVALEDGDAVLVGGRWDAGPLSVTRTLRFDAAAGDWTEIGEPFVEWWEQTDPEQDEGTHKTLGTRHPDGITALLRDGQILAAGEVGPGQVGTRVAELLDPRTGTWTLLPDMPGARIRAEAVTLGDGSVLILGGYSNGGDGYPIALGDAFRLIPGS